MDRTQDKTACTSRCWKLAGIVGIVLALLVLVLGTGAIWALVVGLLVYAGLGLVLTRLLCPEGDQAADVATHAPAAAPAEASPRAAAPVAEPAPAAPVAEPAPAAQPEAAAPEPVEPAPVAAAQPTPSDSALVKPSKPLPGQEELASRRGSWRYEGKPAAS